MWSVNFLLVAVGRAVSAFGNQILRYALPLYLLLMTDSPALFGSIMAISFLPMIVLLPIGGIISDRLHKRNIMLATDLCTALLIVLFCILSERMDAVWLTAVTMIVLYSLDGIDRPAVKASIPVLVDANDILQANSIIDMIDSTAGVAGPVIGGLLLSSLGLMPILYTSVACFAASVLMDLFIHIPFEARPRTKGIVATGFGDLKESFSFLVREQSILWKVALVFAASNMLLTSLMLVGLPSIITQNLGFTPEDASRLYGYAQGVLAAGAVLGGLVAGVWASKLKPQSGFVLLVSCSLCVGVGGVALHGVRAPFAAYMLLVASCGILLTLHTVFQIQVVTILQMLTPNHDLGKVMSCFMCVVMCSMPLGQMLYGFALDSLGDKVFVLFYAAGVGMLAICLLTRPVFSDIALLIQARTMESSPDVAQTIET